MLTYPTAPAPVTGLEAGWLRPAVLADPRRPELATLLATAGDRWSCAPAVAAALFWKRYSWFVVQVALDGWRSGLLPDLAPDRMWVRLDLDGAGLVVHPETRRRRTCPGGSVHCARWLREAVLDVHLAPILERLHEQTRAGRRLLWGSAAHAIAYPVAQRADDQGDDPVETVSRLLRLVGPQVEGLVTVHRDDTGEMQLTRRTCCLAFRSGDATGDGALCPYCPAAGRSC